MKVEEGDSPSDREQQSTLMSQLNAATEKYLHASGARDLAAKQQALTDMRDYSKRIYALGDEVKEKHGGTLPAWWDE